jgi:(1->4)-alpha-D-glucan 1-alpha-D-glucosylmutase
MGVGGSDNPAWLDVLEWGRNAAHAGWFDIDWSPDRGYLRDKLLVPCLGDQFGVALEAGQLRLKFDAAQGSFAVWAHDQHKLPICPLHYSRILGDLHQTLEQLGDAFSALPEWRPQVARRAAELKATLQAQACAQSDVRHAIDAAVAGFNGDPGRLETWGRLDALIARQHWRVAHFRVAADDINYRRFFNINDLAGLRMELPDVFDHTHRLVLRLLRKGILDGLRIDHIDGLLDPKAYLEQLRAAGGPDFYLVVEKIAAHHEMLREDWPVAGTTGYEFVNQVLALLIDPAGEAGFERLYSGFTGAATPFSEIVRECKLRIMENEMASELNVLARDAARVARQNPRTADFTRNILRRALREIVACFPVYRTYVDTRSEPTEQDRRDLDWALTHARRQDPAIDSSAFDFLAAMLSGDLVAGPRSGFSRTAVLRCAMKAQQYSGPVMAKGLEDTAFYRYHRFIALNEVGGHPDAFGAPVSAFHKANRGRAQHWPAAMLATATHDTKRGEDVRARLAVLSELPEEWERQVQTWSHLLRARRGDIEGTAPPDRGDEYMFYQLLVGSWPVELLGESVLDTPILHEYARRIKATLIKSLREAKLHSTWAAPDLQYEDAMTSFVDTALDPDSSGNFMTGFRRFVNRVAALGARNSLIQTVMKLTTPGVPDIYQGCELWDLSLVDPDNRRPVDYDIRAMILHELARRSMAGEDLALPDLLISWQDGNFKIATIWLLLQLRKRHPDLFAAGTYEPVSVEGEDRDEIVAFLRQTDSCTMLVAATRFPARCALRGTPPDARLTLPHSVADGPWHEVLLAREVKTRRSVLDARLIFRHLPVTVMIRA